MRTFLSCLLLVLAALPAAGGLAAQEAAQEPVTRVNVSTTRDPVDKSYRKMIKGMERFEREHALAPAAPLRFQLLPRGCGQRVTARGPVS